jgi:hypothetical protein
LGRLRTHDRRDLATSTSYGLQHDSHPVFAKLRLNVMHGCGVSEGHALVAVPRGKLCARSASMNTVSQDCVKLSRLAYTTKQIDQR